MNNFQKRNKETETKAIPGGWVMSSIGDFLSFEYGKALKEEKRVRGNVPVYGSNGIVGFHDEKLVDGPGIIVGRKGSAGEVIYSNKEFFPIDTTYFVKTDLDKSFIYYLLKNFDLKKLVGSSAVPGLNRNDVYYQKVTIPTSEQEQKQIAEILSSLDDKIELNRKINANLENLAVALFKKWFVDIGDDLPEGWRMGMLGEEFEIVMGQSPAGDTYNENGEGLPFYQGRTDFGFRFPSRRIYCTDPKRIARALDTLVSVRAPVGDVNMAYEECCIGRGVGAVRKKDFPSYTFYMIKSLQNEISKFDSEGTVFGSINKDSFSNIPCVVPPKEEVVKFEKVASEIDGQILNLSREIENLQTIRDSLLPRLMSGKIRVNL